MNGPNGQKGFASTPQCHACSEADLASASEHEGPVRGEAPDCGSTGSCQRSDFPRPLCTKGLPNWFARPNQFIRRFRWPIAGF